MSDFNFFLSRRSSQLDRTLLLEERAQIGHDSVAYAGDPSDAL
jgi:hypothetical protein